MKIIITESQFNILKEITEKEISKRCSDINTNPTELQKKASNYKMGHISIKGIGITIENPRGSERKYKNEDGTEGHVVMKNHYGYFRNTSGNGKDGDAVDVFIGPNPEGFERVYVIDQNKKDGTFDESKVMIGFDSKEQAKKAYMSNYNPGWTGFRAITSVSLRLFKKWLYRGNKQRKPFSEYVEIQRKKLEEAKKPKNDFEKRLKKAYFMVVDKHVTIQSAALANCTSDPNDCLRLIQRLKKIFSNPFSELNEDVFANTKKIKKNTIGLTYDKHTAKNKNNFASFDMLNTEKMDESNEDTYEVTLKGGITSYNITSINGKEVMHYFKRKFLKSGVATTIKNGNSEYELFMEDNEFRNFLNVFESKVNRVINYCINNFNRNGNEFKPTKVSIYPVPSNSNFNIEMAKLMSKMSLCGLPTQVINTEMLVKDLKNLKKDEDFISKNKEYYNGPMSKIKSDKNFSSSVEKYIDNDINKYAALRKAQEYIESLNECAKKILSNYYTYRNSGKKSTLANMAKYYKEYSDILTSMRQVTYSNVLNNGEKSGFNFETIATQLKYTKRPSVEARSPEIWALVKPFFRGKISELNGKSYGPLEINQWEKAKPQIKPLTNGERMGLRNYYSQNENPELVQQELEKIKGGVFVIFDDNISGGATLSDICYQCKEIGIEYIIPITFGKMSEKWTLNMLPLTRPKDKNGNFGFNF